MSYWDTRANTERSPRRLEVKLSDGARLGPPPDGWTPELLELCGLLPVVDTRKPDDTPDATHVRSVELVAGVPTVTWTPRAWTVDEVAARTAEDNGRTIRAGALNALAANRAFLANGAPTAAELRAQVAALTRQNTAIIRSVFGALDGTD